MYKIYNETKNRSPIDRCTGIVSEFSTIKEAEEALSEYIENQFIEKSRLGVGPSDSECVFEILTTTISKTIRPEPTVKTGVKLTEE